MKLGEVLKLFDMFHTNIVVWKLEDDENEPAFQGFLADLPYWLLDMEIDGTGQLCTGTYNNGRNKAEIGALIVEIKDSE